MKTDPSRLLVLLSISTIVIAVFGLWLFAQIEQPVLVSPLEATVASLPIGITAEQANKHMGSAPDSIERTRGVLATPVTMLAPENDLASEYGPAEEFTLRRWTRNGVNAIVAIDDDGKVAGRWSWRPSESK